MEVVQQIKTVIHPFIYTCKSSFFLLLYSNELEEMKSLQKPEIQTDCNQSDKFKLALEQTPMAVFIMDKDWNFEYVNPEYERLSGYTKEELLNKSIAETIFKDFKDLPESRQEIVEWLNNGHCWNGELLTTNRNGSRYWAETSASPFLDESGQIQGYIVIQHDVTERKEMISKLKERELLHETLVADSLEGVGIMQNYRFLYVNKVFSETFGYTFEELNRIDPRILIAPDDRERVSSYHQKRTQGHFAPNNYTGQFIRKDGSLFTGEIISSVIQLNGEYASFVSMRDITEKVKMEKALRESEAKYKALVENSLDGILIVREYRFLYANNTLCKMLGYENEALFAQTPLESIHPEDRHKLIRIAQRRLSGDFSSTTGEFRMIRSDGKCLTCEFYSTVINYGGESAGFFTIHDITERRRMQEALSESEQQYRNLIDKATDGIVITQDRLLKFANQAMCEMMQMDQDEMLEKPFFDYVIPEDHEEVLEYHKRRMSGEKFNALYRSHFIRKDKQIITVELNARTLEFNGRPSAFIVIRDITDRLKIEEELKIAKNELETLNKHLEKRVQESSESLTEAKTQLIRLQKENLQSQFEVLRQQVNPHFLFNSLNVLTSLIRLEPDLAEKFTEHLSKVYRYVLENKDNDLVELRTELDFLHAYLFLINIRFMGKIDVEIDISNEASDWLILPLALQLLIENAIKHNAMSKKNPLRIYIYIDDDHFLNVMNNLQERESYIASTGVGLKNIEHRYTLLEMPSPVFLKTEHEFIAKIPLKTSSRQK
jgi:PAS domain S-box-containing protein